jgi:hypothetical protein
VKYSQKLRAWLFAQDLIAAVDASDELVAAALTGFFVARGQTVPEDSEQILAALKWTAKAETPAAPTPPPVPPAAPVDVDAAVARALQAEDGRRAGISARAQLLGLAADSVELQTALADRSVTPDTFAAGVCQRAIAANTPLPVAPRITSGEAALDKFGEAVVHALLLRSGDALIALGTQDGVTTPTQAHETLTKLVKDNPTIRQVAGMSWEQIVRQAVDLGGRRPGDQSMTAYAQAFIKLQGTEERVFAQGHPRIDPFGMAMSAASPMTGPGDYPGIMDGVMRKIVEYALSVAPVTYPDAASRMPDAVNFMPEEIRELGYRGNLPEHIDGQPYDQSAAGAQTLGFIQVAEFGRQFALSWRTMLSDPMDYLIQGLGQDQIAHERTLNELVWNLLLTNVNSPIDSLPIFDTVTHKNDVSHGSGAAPSITTAKAMRKQILQQKLTTDSTREAGLDLSDVFVGSEWWTDAQIVFLDVARLNYLPAQDTYVNPFRGIVTPHYEPLLSAHLDGKWWFGCSNPKGFVRGLRYRFLQGFGPGGRRDAYYDPAAICQHYRVRGAFAAIIHHHECWARNPGE